MPKFVIGIGSQRAGSTLVHRILEQCSPVMMHPVKELHYFDTKYAIRNQNVLTDFSKRQMDREITELVDTRGRLGVTHRMATSLRANWLLASRKVEDIDYLDLYRPHLSRHAFVGEVTPEYMLLRGDQIADLAQMVGRDARIFLITRDPVERFISAFKLLKMYGGGTIDPERFSEELVTTLETMPGWVDQQIQLSDYEGARTAFEEHFDEVLVLSYEGIVDDIDTAMDELSRFIGTEIDREKVQSIVATKVNAIGETGQISDDAMRLLKQKILPVEGGA